MLLNDLMFAWYHCNALPGNIKAVSGFLESWFILYRYKKLKNHIMLLWRLVWDPIPGCWQSICKKDITIYTVLLAWKTYRQYTAWQKSHKTDLDMISYILQHTIPRHTIYMARVSSIDNMHELHYNPICIGIHGFHISFSYSPWVIPRYGNLSLPTIVDIKNNAWVTVNNDFWSRVRWFANDFHEWRSHEWKSLANHLTSD